MNDMVNIFLIGIHKDNFDYNQTLAQTTITIYSLMKIAIVGGGICGLTTALTAKNIGITPLVIEQRPDVLTQTFGGGIGLWPPSQMVFEQLGLLHQLEQISGIMPSASYFNHKGHKLGQPSYYFPQRYRILCLERTSLINILYRQCLNQGIEIKTGVTVTKALSSPSAVAINLSSGESIEVNALIGADGINSQIRSIIMQEQSKPEVRPYHCGYAYFRAVVDLSKHPRKASKFHEYAFESWGQQKRFGYVPLKYPLTFWFVAIPINKYGLQEYQGSHSCSEDQKQWILQLFQHWKAPVDIQDLIKYTPAETILRTDIRKIRGVTTFPWNSVHNNILIIGDAANATAPNLAQGAGLAIESAWDLVSMVDFRDGSGVKQFMDKRRKRAQTVQNMADLVARVGQLSRPFSDLRDLTMSAATKYFSRLESRIFQETVRYSLGGSSSCLHWIAAYRPSKECKQHLRRCILEQTVGTDTFELLPEKTRIFRSTFIGDGRGRVSVKAGKGSNLFGLSSSMQDKAFGAYVDTYFEPRFNTMIQKWTRVFNEGEKGASLYSTQFRATPFFGTKGSGLIMTESMGTDFFRDLIRFGYDIQITENKIFYKSEGLWLSNFKLPIPRFLLPTSKWYQEQTQQGWTFNGTINYPKILGGSPLFQYSGKFEPRSPKKYEGRKVVIAGGSGFIGKTVARIFHQNGWEVTILSRSAQPIQQLPFAKVHKWNPQVSVDFTSQEVESIGKLLADKDVVVNLAGENPAGVRWTENKKNKILESRLRSIDLIAAAINKYSLKDIIYFQSSAVGIYGSRNDQILGESAPIGTDPNNFRIKCTKSLEQNTIKQCPEAVILRIGHVLGSEGGMFPFLKLFSVLRGKKYGSGGQYLPWIHVEDIAHAIIHIIGKHAAYTGKIVNLASPEHHTYDSFYKVMGQLHNRTPLFRVPEWVFKLMLGQLSSVLLESQRSQPQLLLDNGFQFQFASLKKCLCSRALL